jgi:hypothetical protein
MVLLAGDCCAEYRNGGLHHEVQPELAGYDTGRQTLLPKSSVCIVRKWLNPESDPLPDPTLSKAPEERADSRVCIPP